VIGPHFDEINPLLSQESQDQIDIVMQYKESDWQSISNYVKDKNMPVGNSTAANLACATTLANQGRTVLTIIFEPRRFFYEKK
jgi:malate/lactate dehydrogenase